MFAYEQEEVVPDILTLSKTLGGGITISCTTTSAEIKQTIMERGFFHSSTHAFDPLPAYVALAVIETIEKDNLVQQSKEKGNYLREGLQKLAKRHLIIGDIRGRGLLQGIELVKDRYTREPADKEAHMVHRRCIEKGLLLRIVGMPNSRSVLNFTPPFCVTLEEIDTSLNILEETLYEVEKYVE
jgi:2,2-dialkylglycine decarboxylase (pyruvate)